MSSRIKPLAYACCKIYDVEHQVISSFQIKGHERIKWKMSRPSDSLQIGSVRVILCPSPSSSVNSEWRRSIQFSHTDILHSLQKKLRPSLEWPLSLTAAMSEKQTVYYLRQQAALTESRVFFSKSSVILV